MIGITPRKGDKIWVLLESTASKVKLEAVFLGYEKGRPLVRFPDGTREHLLSDNYMRVR